MSIAGRLVPKLFITQHYRNTALQLQECNIHRWVAPTYRELQSRVDKRVKNKIPNPRNTYLEWNQNAEVFAFGKRLKEEFDPKLLRRALTHRTYIIQEESKQKAVGIENPDLKIQDNAELIEEGESFMYDYIRKYLEVALPKFPDAGIIAVRDHLMSTEMMARVSSLLGTKDLILTSEYPVQDDTLAKTFKAVVAALVHSSGTEQAAHFVRDFVITNLNGVDVNELWEIEKPMEMLKDLLKKSNMSEPEPRLISQTAKNTILACHRVGIYVDKELLSAGFGESVDTAIEVAARNGLKIIFGTPDHMPPLDFKICGIPQRSLRKEKSVRAS